MDEYKSHTSIDQKLKEAKATTTAETRNSFPAE
jgi:hypothetical protein